MCRPLKRHSTGVSNGNKRHRLDQSLGRRNNNPNAPSNAGATVDVYQSTQDQLETADEANTQPNDVPIALLHVKEPSSY